MQSCLPPFLLLCALAGAELDGVRFEDRVTLEETELVLNGAGMRLATIFNIKAYAAALYVPRKTKDAAEILRAETPKQVIMVFRRDVPKNRAAKTFREHVAANASKTITRELESLEQWIPDFARGDRLTVTCLPGSGVTITASNKKESLRGSAEFGTALLSMWIGPKPVDEDLRTAMLEGG
jgi:hypothetical protein